jgi:hypothetical protein
MREFAGFCRAAGFPCRFFGVSAFGSAGRRHGPGPGGRGTSWDQAVFGPARAEDDGSIERFLFLGRKTQQRQSPGQARVIKMAKRKYEVPKIT